MIAKNIKTQSFGGCVGYVMKKDAEVLKAEGVMAMSKEDMITSTVTSTVTSTATSASNIYISSSFFSENLSILIKYSIFEEISNIKDHDKEDSPYGIW